MNATGTNTAHSTSTMAISAPLTSAIASSEACAGLTCRSAMMRSTFSTTTMASSTTMPMASTRPKSVMELIENPNICMPKNVPMMDTGTASAGMSVARQLCRKMNTTRNTSTIASTSVCTTSSMEASTNGVVSYTISAGRRAGTSGPVPRGGPRSPRAPRARWRPSAGTPG